MGSPVGYHRVPLAPRALEILEGQKDQHETLVFPSVRDQVELSDMALTSLLRRLKAHSDIPGRVATAHGFRSSFRDWCSEKGYSRDLAERSLAHTIKDKVEAAYHRTDLLEQRRELMSAWEAFVNDKLPIEVATAPAATQIPPLMATSNSPT